MCIKKMKNNTKIYNLFGPADIFTLLYSINTRKLIGVLLLENLSTYNFKRSKIEAQE